MDFLDAIVVDAVQAGAEESHLVRSAPDEVVIRSDQRTYSHERMQTTNEAIGDLSATPCLTGRTFPKRRVCDQPRTTQLKETMCRS
jgi:hypothetical protein